MGLSKVPSPAMLDALRMASLSEDGRALTLNGQLEADTYRRVKKMLDEYGGKWNRKTGAHDFDSDFRPHLNHLLGGGKVGADNGGKNPLAFYRTPAPLVQSLLGMLPDLRGVRVLEPSAGDGAIADALRDAGALVDVLELDDTRHAQLTAAGHTSVGRDFLTWTPAEQYPVIVMNPPFSTPDDAQAYLTHIDRAWTTCLEPGGVLVAIAPVGFTYRADMRPTSLRLTVQGFGHHVYNDQNAFATSGASVHTATLVVRKPLKEERAMPTAPASETVRTSVKKTRVKPEEAPSNFKELAEKTRAKMKAPARTSSLRTAQAALAPAAPEVSAPSEADLPFPVTEAQLDAAIVEPAPAPDLFELRHTFPVGAPISWQQSSGDQGELATLTGVVISHSPPSTLGYCTVAPALSASAPRTEVKVRNLSRMDPSEAAARLPVGTAVEFLCAAPGGITPAPVLGTVMKYVWDEPCEQVIGYLIAPIGNEEFAETWQEVSPFDDSLIALDLPAQDVPALAEVAPNPILNTDQLSWLPVTALVASPLNPRKKFPQEELESLANSIAAKGLMQNLVGRVTPDRRVVEIIAGGRRLRALTLLEEAGRLPEGYLVPVRVQNMTDLDALMLAVAENSERADVEPLEEADAFVEMIRLGATPEDIALRFKCSPRAVEKRLVLAHGLGEDGRALLDSKAISISQAQVIAQASGPLRSHVITAAKRGDTVKSLQSLIAKSTFLVDRAKFDVAASGLEIVEDLFGSEPARFADPKAALALQLDWAENRRKVLSKKKEQFFVEVRKVNDSYLQLPHDSYTTYDAPNSIIGTVIMVSTITGEVSERRCARTADVKSARAKEQAKTRAQTASEATGSGGGAIRKSGWVDAHEARATALRAALVGDHKRAVALTILSTLQAQPVTLRGSLDHTQAVPITAGMKRLKEIDAKLGGKLGVNDHHLPKRPITKKFGGDNDGVEVLPYLDLLMTLTLEDLLDVQSVLIAQAVGGWTDYNPMHVPFAFVARLAADTGAKVQMKLTDAHLKAYPRDRLIELAEDAGITQGHGLKGGHISTLATNTDLRAAILQHADALAERGYVPPLARFPEAAAPQAAATAAD